MSSISDPKWWQTGVVYHIYPRSWADGNGDGVGDFEGMIARLDYLVDTLPVNAVWLSPFYPSPMADFGYDVSDYTGIDPVFGDLDDFDRFLTAAHQRDLKVIVDYVPNHTSDRHPWFLDSRSGRTSAKRDWYVWRDPASGGGPPNNWKSSFGGDAWTFDGTSGQYYLHSFLPEQPDLNWRSPEVEEAMFEVLRFWLERGVDGFRIDVAHRCMKDPKLRSNPPARHIREDAYKLNPEFAAQEHIYDVAHPDIHLLFQRLRAVVDEYESISPRFTIGEIHEYDWRVWSAYHGWALDELHMTYNFTLLPVGLNAEGIRRAVEEMEAALPTGAWPNWVVGNHDEPRITKRYGREQSKAAAVLLLTLRGTPTIYYGDEIGMTEADIPPEDQQDPWGRRMPGYGRDGCRTPMQWDAGRHAGFSPESAPSTWLPVQDQDRISVAAELDDPGSHLFLYRALLDGRNRYPELCLGEIEFCSSWDRTNPLVYRRSLGGTSLVVALNLSGDAPSFGVGDVEGREVVIGTHPDRIGTRVTADTPMRPWEAVVLR